jgi:hypothetical protein
VRSTGKAMVGIGAALVAVAGVGIGVAATVGGASSSAPPCHGTKEHGAEVAALDEAEHDPIGQWATATFGALVTHHRLPSLPSGTGWKVVSSQPTGPVVTVTLAHNGETTEVPVAMVCADGRWRIGDQGVSVTHVSSSHTSEGAAAQARAPGS